ncbi:DUF4230 domain-containing protein [Planosporangium mesophilum]|uniref:DUF4230 domain-containing protein n=1 Tax=Planosporangium mesophilum TaxID=689768 RepID=A0A8J3X2J3_9ACTN|nr:DUF4230 domain-containing protein [Planosporangium mesophilum]NJC82614.1 DUF4230 domain-containing protein [Planosporangium mesophilum]GII24981.1 hypothetical protein Pme01_45780 [Planosporangium mesophilum]
MAQDNETTRFERGQAAPSGSAGDLHPTAELPTRDHDTGTGWPDAPDSDSRGPVVVRTGGGLLRGLFFLTATVAVVVATVLGLVATGVLPQIKNPFGARTTDRSQPPLLKSIQDMSRFVAAEGNFQVIVDVQNDTKYVPDFLVNDRTLFVATGTVEAYVDFSAISQGAITESADHKTVEIRLPAPQLNKPSMNHDKSYVFAQQKGILNQLGDVFAGDPNKLQRLYQLGEQKIADAAKSSELQQRAEDNTRKMLEGMLRSLGYTSVTIKYAAP